MRGKAQRWKDTQPMFPPLGDSCFDPTHKNEIRPPCLLGLLWLCVAISCLLILGGPMQTQTMWGTLTAHVHCARVVRGPQVHMQEMAILPSGLGGAISLRPGFG